MAEQTIDPIYVQALEWFVRMQDPGATEQERQSFSAWLASAPEHGRAYDRAAFLWERFDVIKPEYKALRRKGGLSRRSLLLGGVVAAAAVPGSYFLARGISPGDYRTGIGERIAVALPDGSSVELGSYSALSLDFQPGLRRVRLHYGQAFFNVAPAKDSAFVVSADTSEAKALGTQFDIRFVDGLATLTVLESSVELHQPDGTPLLVATGWQVDYGAKGRGELRRANLSAVQAWRQDRIYFEDLPLRSVLAELERYRRGKIVLVDPDVAEIPVTAVFDTKESSEALTALAETLPIRVLETGFVAFVFRRR